MLMLLRRLAGPLLIAAAPLSACAVLPGRPAAAPLIVPAPSFADLADLTLAAPVIADLVVSRVRGVPEEATAGVAPGRVRVLVEGNLNALLTGPGTLPGSVRFLADLPADDRGRAPALNGERLLVFARTSGGRPDDLTLVAPDSLLPWTPERDRQVRAIARDALAAGAPPPITGITSAFNAPGTLEGESTTQIFLATATGQPISLTVFNSPAAGASAPLRRWGISAGEVVGPNPEPPQRDTLLWYRLACGLPERIDPARVEAPDERSRAAALADYDYVRQAIGPCERTRGAPVVCG